MKAGLKPAEIEDMNWRDFSLFITAYELREREEWERLRLLLYSNYVYHGGDKAKKSITAYYPFPWDKKEDRGRELTPEELDNIFNLYNGSTVKGDT